MKPYLSKKADPLASPYFGKLMDALANPHASDPTNAWRWPSIVAMLLLTSMACGIGWLMLGVAAVRWQRRRSRPVLDRDLLELVDVLRAELGCRRPIEIRQADDLATAATIGWRRPVVLLPADWMIWTVDQRRAVLAHEIAHARSHDFIALLIGQLGLAMHFYHPLLHWLTNRLRLEQELAADAAAASISGGQRQYLTTIAELALRQHDRPLLWPARAFLPTQSTFLRRIAMLRDSKLRFDRLSPLVRLTTVAAVLLCGLLVAGLRAPIGSSAAVGQAVPDAASSQAQPDLQVLDSTFLSESARSIIVMRPAAAFARPEVERLMKLLQGSLMIGTIDTQLSDLRQITVVVPGAPVPSGPREVGVYQWLKPVAGQRLAAAIGTRDHAVKEYDGKKTYIHGRRATMLYDEYTFIEAGSEQALCAYLAEKRGVPPKWLPAKAWESFRNDHVLLAVGPEMIQATMKPLVDRSPPLIKVPMMAVSPLWQDTDSMAVGARLDDEVTVHAWLAAKSADAASNVRSTAEAVKTLVQAATKNARTSLNSNQPSGRVGLMLLDLSDRLLDNLKFQQDGSAVQLATSAEMDKSWPDALAEQIAKTRKTAEKPQSTNNLKMLALAMLNYENAFKRFPPAVLYGPDGKTPYSWRVAVLPYLEQENLYKQYRFDEPWDGPNNRQLLDRMPDVFRSPTEPAGSKNVCYFALTGPGTVFDGKQGTPMLRIVDGSSNTLLLVEAKRDIPWTKPEDIPYDQEKPLPKLGGYFEGGFNAAICDGSVHFLPNTIPEKNLRALITKADRQPVRLDEALRSAR